MPERLIIKNFGPLKVVDLEIKSTMVFIGPQSSGKSTIAKLLAIFRDIEFVIDGYKEVSTNQYFQTYNISNYFQKDSYLEYINADYKIIFNKKYWSVIKTDEFDNKITQEKARIEELVRGVVDSNPRLKVSDNEEDKEKMVKQIYEINWRRLFGVHREQTYVPAERILTSIIADAAFSFNDISLPGALKQFGKEFERARNTIVKQKAEIPFLNISYQYEEKDSKKGFRIYYDETESVSLNESSSGIQSILPIHIVISYLTNNKSSKHSFIVEEPELNLFPTAQKAVVNFLIEKANHQNELIITTHSPYVLSVLNNLLFAFNVASKNSNTFDEISKVIPQNIWIDSENFIAYHLSEGKSTNLINPKTKLIHDNFLDTVSQDIIGERDKLLDIYKTANAKVN